MTTLKTPQNQEDWNTYFNLRWKTLRAPWDQPPGSEKDELEAVAFHLMAVNQVGTAVGCGRLHQADSLTGQIRYMGVLETERGSGVGAALVEGLEEEARKQGLKKIVLNAREIAIPFYERAGYSIREKSYLMWGTIQHFLMEREL